MAAFSVKLAHRRAGFAMRACLRSSSGEANDAARWVAHAVASNASSSVEQPVEAFVSIEAVNRWLNSRGELPSSSDCERLRAAVVVLTSKPKPRKEDVRPLCFSCPRKKMVKRSCVAVQVSLLSVEAHESVRAGAWLIHRQSQAKNLS